MSDEGMHASIFSIKPPCTPLVRVPDGLPHLIKRALDAGAHGICVPMVNTAAQAKAIADQCYFPPKGIRGLGSPFSMASFTPGGTQASLGEYFFQANDQILCIVQIETKEAVDNVEEIAKVPGVHMLLIGPFDLSNFLGVPLVNGETEVLKNAIAKVKKAAEAAGKWTGIFCTSPADAKRRTEEGWNLIALGSETAYLERSITEGLAIARGDKVEDAAVKY